MIVKDFLHLISDEEARIKLEIVSHDSDEYEYHTFWLSDYREGCDFKYDGWEIIDISFEMKCDIVLQIKPQK